MTVEVDRVISSVTLAGSLLSCLATTLVLLSFVIYRRQLRSFRHILVLSLTVAEFINSLNNSVSGIIFVRTGELRAGTPCVMNALIGQLSVQAADFSILAIALVTLLTVTRVIYLPSVSTTRKVIICISVWALPAMTSVIPTIMGEMEPVGGNWCWISADRPDLRYGMTHGWRFLVIFSTIAIYIYIGTYLRRHLGTKGANNHRFSYFTTTRSNKTSGSSCFGKKSGFQPVEDEGAELDRLDQPRTDNVMPYSPGLSQESRFLPDNNQRDGRNADGKNETGESDIEAQSISYVEAGSANRSNIIQSSGFSKEVGLKSPTTAHVGPGRDDAQNNTLQTNVSEFPIRRGTLEVEVEIKRMMLLNAYPFMYVILWIPGLVNRLMEASGNPPSKTVGAALQASTQFVGFANAVTYGFNHHLRDRLKGMYLTPAISKARRRLRMGDR